MNGDENFKNIAEHIPDALLVIAGGKILWSNSAANELFDVGCAESDKAIVSFLTARPTAAGSGGGTTAEPSHSEQFESRVSTKKGEIDVSISITRIEFNCASADMYIVRDISKQKETEQKLLTIAFEFQGVFEAFPDLYFKLDADGIIKDAKAGTMQEFYVPPIEFINKKISEVLPYEAGRKISAALSDVITNGKGASIFYSLPYPDGDKHFEARFLPMPDGVAGAFVRDMTELKTFEQRLLENDKFLSGIFDSIQDGITVLDTELNIVRANKTIEKWVSPDKLPIVGKKCYDAYHDFESPCDHCPSIRALKTGKINSEIFEKKSDDGEKTTWFELYAFPLTDQADGGTVGVIEYLRDITARRMAENELLKNTERMEKLIEKRTTELNSAYDKLLSSERLSVLGQFAGGIAHEIRNPLNVISTSVFYVKRKLLQDNDKAVEYMDKIQKQVENCNGIIESILRLTQIQPPMLKRTDIGAFISQLLDARNLPGNVRLEKEMPSRTMFAMADTDQIGIAVTNLVKNAVQSMPDGGVIRCSVESSNGTDGDECVIAIEDNGTGISKENVGKIFEPLFTTKTHGIGFGLSIVKAVMEKHDGRVEVTSEPGKGTTFRLILKEIK